MIDKDMVRTLGNWFDQAERDLPWRGDRSPYEIWVSEVMLQQTQVATVEDYYEDFLNKFPTVDDLAEASRDEVLKAWEGMGFYARARRLHDAAQTVVSEYGGELPPEYKELKSLSGIGDYTAAAISAFAFDGRKPVMDSNVKRVVARIEGIETPLDRSDTEARIRTVLEEFLEATVSPGRLSESLMELGSLVCRSGKPECARCPVSGKCDAFQRNRTGVIPETDSRTERIHHEIAVGVIEDGEDVLISRRPEEKMLGGLWEFPGGKVEDGETLRDALVRELEEELGITVSVEGKMREVPHEYSHMTINLHAYSCSIKEGKPSSNEGQCWEWVSRDELVNYAFPKANKQILDELITNESEVTSSG